MSEKPKANSKRAVFYAGVGPELRQYDIDVAGAALIRRGTVKVPVNVQYGWQHVSKNFFYVSSSSRGPGAGGGTPVVAHYLNAFRVDRKSGALQPHGAPFALPQRPIHTTLDATSSHVLVAYSEPSALTVHAIKRDGTLGEVVKQRITIDAGIYAHQVRVTPSNATVILVTRGHDAKQGKPEDPGALKVFNYKNGLLSNEVSVAPGGGYGFGPRHLDFHPTKPWVYVALERQNLLCVFKLTKGVVSREPVFSTQTLAEPDNRRPRQLTGTVHVHPNGRFVYSAERGTEDIAGTPDSVYNGGENSIVAFAINQSTGEPEFIQRVDTRGMHPRTFCIDPSGRLLIVGNKSPVVPASGSQGARIPASLDVFRIGADGKLDFARTYAVDVGSSSMFWSGLLKL